MNRFIATTFFTILVSSFAGIGPAGAIDSYTPSIGTTSSLDTRVNLSGSNSENAISASFLEALVPRGNGALANEYLCMEFGKFPCNFDRSSGVSFSGGLIAPPCTQELETNCLESLSIYSEGENATPAKLVRLTEGVSLKADPERNLTSGATPSLWSGHVAHSGGSSQYLSTVKLGLSFTGGKFQVSSLSANVMPVSLVTGDFPKPTVKQVISADGRSVVQKPVKTIGCVLTESQTCFKEQAFSANSRIKMSLRLSNTIGGWFSGRVQDATLDFTRLSETTNRLTVEASPTLVPQFSAAFNSNSTEEGVRSWVNLLQARPGVISTGVDTGLAFDTIKLLRKTADDAAAGIRIVWSIDSLTFESNPCLVTKSRVIGVVTTNSMAYQGAPPTYVNGSLKYRVAGLHYFSDRQTEVRGEYQLTIAADIARCLYGYSNAPVSASISVTSSDGESKVATSQVSEKNGWLTLSASGFTFSENVISVKLAQTGKAPKPSPTTITCTKGKLTKKITAVAPKCPTGYKKKP